MKKYLLLFVLMLMVVCIGCNNKDQKIIDEFNEKVKNVIDAPKTTAQLNEIFEEYDLLEENQKSAITLWDLLETYRGVDIDKVNMIKDKITSITSSTPFDELLSLKEEINALSAKEQSFVDNLSILESYIELNDLEKAAVSACQYIKKSLKNSSSFELESAKVINDLNGGTKYYLVKIEYSATNSFGGRKDANSFQTINGDFENPWWGLCFITGDFEDALKCTSFIQFYLLHEDDPIELDCDKIMYYIDEKLN